ncbi:MAG: efflux RND transporter periplasmic adaptor subunit [Longimicrobiales bacterium]
MKRRTKWVIGTVGALVVVGGTAAVAAGRNDSALAVRLEPAVRRDLVATVTANGWVRPRSAVEVQSDIMGRIVELRVAEGDHVMDGQLLLRIDPSQYEAAVSRAQAAVSEARATESQARANLLQAQAALDRARRLAAANAELISARELDDVATQATVQEAMHEAATYRVRQAEAALREARDQLAKTVIRAPLSGVVTRLNVEQGEMAIVGTMNNPGSLLLTISDLSVMEAVVQVDETDVPEISLGDTALVEIDAFPRQRFAGIVTEIGHSAVRPPASAVAAGGSAQQAIDFEVVITLTEPPPTLRPDLSSTAEIVTARRDSVITVPIIALTVRERDDSEEIPAESREARAAQARGRAADRDQEGVFVMRDRKAEFVPVQVGIAGQEHFEVLSGVSEGDSIIAGPYEAIRDLEAGQAVRPLAADTAAPGRRG